MGVNRKDYILIGAKLDTSHCTEAFFENAENDVYLSRRHHRKGEIAYLYDGYNEDYFVVGVVVAVGQGEDGFDCLTITPGSIAYEEDEEKARLHIAEKFDEHVEPRIIVVTHLT